MFSYDQLIGPATPGAVQPPRRVRKQKKLLTPLAAAATGFGYALGGLPGAVIGAAAQQILRKI